MKNEPDPNKDDHSLLPMYAAVDAGHQMFFELEAMLKFASGRGLQPAPWISHNAARARRSYERLAPDQRTPEHHKIDSVVLEDVARAHKSLAATIVPATPRSVLTIQVAEDEAQRQIAGRRGLRKTFKQIWFSLGLLPIQRQLSVLGLVFLVLFIIGLMISTPT